MIWHCHTQHIMTEQYMYCVAFFWLTVELNYLIYYMHPWTYVISQLTNFTVHTVL